MGMFFGSALSRESICHLRIDGMANQSLERTRVNARVAQFGWAIQTAINHKFTARSTCCPHSIPLPATACE